MLKGCRLEAGNAYGLLPTVWLKLCGPWDARTCKIIPAVENDAALPAQPQPTGARLSQPRSASFAVRENVMESSE